MKSKLLILLTLLLTSLYGCYNSPINTASPSAMDTVEQNLLNALESFAQNTAERYQITRMKRSDEGFVEYMESLAMDPTPIDEILLLQSEGPDSIVVMRVNDIAKGEIALGAYHDGRAKIWKQYDPTRYQRLKSSMTSSEGAYIYYVLHEQSAMIVDTIGESLGLRAKE